MQLRSSRLVALSLVALLGAVSAPPLSAQAARVRCESQGGSQEQCPIPSNARVELARHLSEMPCRQGQNWGVGTSFIWVNNGCRAEFAVTPTDFGPSTAGAGNASANANQLRACRSEADRRLPAYSYNQIAVEPESRQGSVAYVRWRAGTTEGLCAVAANGRILQFTTGSGDEVGGTGGTTTRIVCESQRTDREECRIPTGARIRLIRQTSQSPCRLNDTYGQGADYVWVAEGCRGEFEVRTVGIRAQGGDGVVGLTRVVCESRSAAREQCRVPGATAVRLNKQYSASPCRLDQSYGVGSGHIWVSNGCRGEFGVTVGRAQMGRPEDGSGLPASPGLANQVTCESKAGERTACPIPQGARVRLVRQLSETPCTEGRTYGTSYGVLWVTEGCRGEFEVR